MLLALPATPAHRPPLAPLYLLPFFLALGCNGSTTGLTPVCDRPSAPAGCGDTCGGAGTCPAGLYCADNDQCNADCLTDQDCPLADVCNPANGRCVPGTRTDGGASDGGSSDGATQDGATTDGSVCADIAVRTASATPNVTMIIDRSGSMTEDFQGRPRWDALKATLIANPGGLIKDLETRVRFGLVMYTATSQDSGANMITSPSCPWLEIDFDPAPGAFCKDASGCGRVVDADINNFGAIEAVYGPAAVVPNGDTPTGDSVDAVVARVTTAPRDPNPDVFIIATDGAPDRCEDPDPTTNAGNAAARNEAVQAVQRAYGEGIRSYVIWVGDLNNATVENHIQDLANAGLGIGGAGSDAPYWIAGNDTSLREALTTIVNGELSCELTLNGRLTLERACSGTVILNGRRLACDDPNGWKALDASTIELQGTACDEFKTTPDATLDASFPCGTVILI